MRKLFLSAVVVGGLVWAWPAAVTAQCNEATCPQCCPSIADDLRLEFCVLNPLVGCGPRDETANCGCDWLETFETYPTGTMQCLNGWEGWSCGDQFRGEITTEQDHTDNGNGVSMAIDSNIDQVWRFYPANAGTYDMTSGGAEGDDIGYDLDVSDCWVFKAWSFVPIGHGGDSFLIMLSRYGDSGPPTGGWAIELVMDATELTNDFGPGTLPLSLGKWVLIEIQVNLDVDSSLIFYDGVFFGAQTWATAADGDPDQLLFSALDLFNSSGSRVYWDDISMDAVDCPPINRPAFECLTTGLDEDRCAEFLWRVTNQNLEGNIAEFYLDIEAGGGGRNSTCRGGGTSTVAIRKLTGWDVTNCTGWGSAANGGHVLFRFNAQTPADELSIGQQVSGIITVDTNLGQEFITTNTGVTVAPFSIVMTAAQRLGNEPSLVCASGNYDFGPTKISAPPQQWGTPTTCTAFLNAPAMDPWAKALLAALLLGGGALLVLRSRRPVTA